MCIKTRKIQIVRADNLDTLEEKVNRLLRKNPEWTPSPAFVDPVAARFFLTLMLTEHHEDGHHDED